MGTFSGGGFGSGGFGGMYPSPPISYYLSLLTSEYQNSPNLQAWLFAMLTPVNDFNTCINSIYQAFDIDTAFGAQLDVIGQIVGAGRTVGFQPSNGVNPTLNDQTYRILLKAKIAQNQWDGHIGSLYPLWRSVFPGGTILIQDQAFGVMTAAITLSGSFSSITQDLITNGLIIPRPEGVMYNYIFVTLPIFGCDLDNSLIAGFDIGHLG